MNFARILPLVTLFAILAVQILPAQQDPPNQQTPVDEPAVVQETQEHTGEEEAVEEQKNEEQPADEKTEEEEATMSAGTFAGLKARLLGPALMSGRVGDFAVNPEDHSEYYVAVCSGGLWKTVNAGVTFTPVFDSQGSYSIGCVTMDPRNHNVVWVGTGENNSQRSVAFGDGVYVTRDGGKNWENVGLKDSEHIGMIAVDPRDSNVVYVAAQGPLWRSGGDRGLYKTTDGGKTWCRILHASEDAGANEIHLAPRDPDVLYASTYQRRRHVWTLIDGGPDSALYKSTDAGATWRKIHKGLPDVDLGRIGLDISPVDPDVVYAIVEAAEGKDGFFRSTDRGETWEKRCGYKATSAQYYNEIVCDPCDVDRVYTLDTFLHVTEDGGKSFQRMPRENRHVDDHALWINPDDNRNLLIGCDGGIYETFDRGANWRYMPNLPVTQFYRIACDNSSPFYYVYGGTQDNSTVGAPSRTTDSIGVANEHWFLTVGGDGYETCVDPEDPMTVYSLWQYGGLVRFDRRSGQRLDIKPREKPGDDPYRWNWDSPLIISPHSHTRLFFAANILFRSDDRGNSWRAVSGDLSRRLNRDELEVFGKIQNADAVSKHNSTSFYGNIVSLCESPLVEDLIYVGTDDGLIQVTENGGANWRKIDAFPDVPELSYVSCITASQHDPDVVFATFDNHKMGDFKPYVLRSDDRGRTWTSIAGDLPERQIAYSLQQDHVKPDLLFVGTEFGAFFTVDGGAQWIKLGGLPTISVRDLEIQRRENDLILGTFGRSIYILDDYTPLRSANTKALEAGPALYPVKDAWSYVESSRLGNSHGRGSQGATFFSTPNPPLGAVFTYYLPEKLMTLREQRKQTEKDAAKAEETPPYPTLDALRAEDEQLEPFIVLVVRDDAGQVVRRIEAPRDKGFHRVAWDLRYPAATPPQLEQPKDYDPWRRLPAGPLALPGAYSVTLMKNEDGRLALLSEEQTFNVTPLELATFAAEDRPALLAFQLNAARLQRAVQGALRAAGEAQNRLRHVRAALRETPPAGDDLFARVETIRARLNDLQVELRGDPTRSRREEPQPPSINGRVQEIVGGLSHVTCPPTQTQRDAYRYAGEQFTTVLAELRKLILEDLQALETELENLGAPWTPGRLPDWQIE